MASQYNKKAGSVKRLLKEAQEIEADPCPEFSAAPLESDLFEWHFTIRVPHSDFEGGLYHGRLLLPQTYPLAPPDIMLLTPNGRFELNKKICLSISGYHHETWQPAWGVRTALLALSAFFETDGKGALGALDTSSEERKKLAKLSQDWTCATCGVKNLDLLGPPPESVDAVQEERPSEAKRAVAPTSEVRADEGSAATRPDAESEARSPSSMGFEPLQTPLPTTTRPTAQATPPPSAERVPAWIDRAIAILVLVFSVLVLRKVGGLGQEASDSVGVSNTT